MSEWKEVRLGDVCEFNPDNLNKRNYPYKNILYLDTSSVIENVFNNFQQLDIKKAPSRARRLVKEKDIIFSSVRPNHKHYGFIEKPKDNLVVSTGFIVIRTLNQIPKFIYYYLTQQQIIDKLQQIAEQRVSTYPSITYEDIANLKIKLPPLPIQKKIADILSVIDEKIETLQNINETLEEMAKAIFKSWFVDFDIVKAKADGKSNSEIAKEFGISEEIVKLFPSEFVESEVGMIPKGWEVVPFSNIAKLDTTSVKPFEFPERIWKHYSIPAYDSKHYPEFEKGINIKSNKYKVHKNSILVSKLNPTIPRVWLPNIKDTDFAICSTEFMQFVPYKSDMRFFVYLIITSKPFQDEIKSRVTGTTGSRQRAQPKQVAKISTYLPSPKLISTMNEIIYPILQKTVENLEEIQTLQELRDTLIPKLINGEIEVDDSEIKGIT